MRHMTEEPTRLCWPPESRSRTRRPQVRTCPSSTSWPISPLIINGHNEILLKSTCLRGVLFQDMFAVLSSCLLLGQVASALSAETLRSDYASASSPRLTCRKTGCTDVFLSIPLYICHVSNHAENSALWICDVCASSNCGAARNTTMSLWRGDDAASLALR